MGITISITLEITTSHAVRSTVCVFDEFHQKLIQVNLGICLKIYLGITPTFFKLYLGIIDKSNSSIY